jgi:3-hydroxyacyl-CoA dehydrogenase
MTADQTAPVGVIGGGRMGAGIAHVLAAAGSQVTIVESRPDAQRAAMVSTTKLQSPVVAR